jgi:hypothetical protein
MIAFAPAPEMLSVGIATTIFDSFAEVPMVIVPGLRRLVLMFMKPTRSSRASPKVLVASVVVPLLPFCVIVPVSPDKFPFRVRVPVAFSKPALPIMALFTVLVPKKAPGVEPKAIVPPV